MKPLFHPVMAVWFSIIAMAPWFAAAEGASPSASQALKLVPIQQAVDFSRPTAEEAPECKIGAREFGGKMGWIVEDPDGLILRKFVDTNGDNVVDQWSYYKDGVEVYRDIDTDFNGKADQYRWFHTGGSRWGLDNDQDGKIDAWKAISAEEVTAEVIASLADKDAGRFGRLVLTPAELKSLGLGEEKAAELATKIGPLAKDFSTAAAGQQTVTPQTRWVQFSGTKPGIVPAGTDGSTRDLRVYENVTAVIQTGEKHGHVQIGTLVQVGDVWRAIDVPRVVTGGETELVSGFFFRPPMIQRNIPAGDAPDEEVQKLLTELEKLDPDAIAQRAALLEKIAAEVRRPEDRAMWLRELVDMLGAAVPQGTFPEGVQRLEAMFAKLQKNEADKELAAHVRFVLLTAEYGGKFEQPKPDFAKIQEWWLKHLEQYVRAYPAAADSAEAMLQLAIAREFSGQEDDAKKWYGRIVAAFPNSPAARKAAGARIRLDSVGKTLALVGKSSSGGTINLTSFRGRVVLIQFWATWSERAKSDMPALKELASKYSRSLSIIGVNLDNSAQDLAAYLAENRLPWPQIYEAGGLDSRPANQMGILSLPTMILVDSQGKVVNRNIQVAELDGALKKLIR